VLIRKFRYNQNIATIMKGMEQSRHYVQQFLDEGMEKFGEI